MTFAQPYWLAAGLAVCLSLIWRYWRFNRQQRAALASFVSPRLFDKLTATVSPGRRRLRQGLLVAGVALVFTALARPLVGYRWEEVHRTGIELLVAVDTSKSMLTEDVKPNRLGRAKLAVDDLVDKLDGDGVGLEAFAGDAFLVSPITVDYSAFRDSLDALDTNTISRGGTDIGGAIREAQAVLDARAGKEKVLVLVTDGEDLNGDAVAAAQAAGRDGMKIFTVGVGTAAGELIPVPGANGGTDFVRDPAGQFVKLRLDESTLNQIAGATGGMYEPLGQEGQGLAAIYNDGLARFTRHDLASRQNKVYTDRFQWPLLAGIACLVGELLIGTRKLWPRAVRAAPEAPAAAGGPWLPARVAMAVTLAFLVAPTVGRASPAGAESDYQKGDYAAAEKQYQASLAKRPKQPQLEFNVGAAAYKAGDYAKAAAAFGNALGSTDVPLQQSAYYNLGNTQFRAGQKDAQANPQEAIKTWQQAVQSYDSALQITPGDADAKFNRDLVQRRLEELQQQERQKQDQQKKDQQQNQQSESQPQSGQSGKPDQKKQSGQGQDGQGQQGSQGQQNPQQGKGGSTQDGKSPAKPGQHCQASKPEQSQSGQPGGAKRDVRKPEGQQPGSGKGEGPKQGSAPGGTAQQQPEQQGDQGEPSKAGQMSKEDAKQLLDSVKGDEHTLPAAQVPRGQAKAKDDQPFRDW
jgi:Ca-activated chloride channel family protein